MIVFIALAYQRQQSPQIKPLNPLNQNLLLGQSQKLQKILPPSAAGSISAGNPPLSLFPKFNRRNSQEIERKFDLSQEPIDVEVRGESKSIRILLQNEKKNDFFIKFIL